MEEFKIYSITDEYISFLQGKYPNVYSNKMEHRTHTRKYIGTVMNINGRCYYIPMSSPKDSDYQVAGEGKVIKKSIVPIIRIVTKNYRELVKDEWIFIRRNKEKIISFANVMYKQKRDNNSIGYVKAALDYKALEELCREYENKKNVDDEKYGS